VQGLRGSRAAPTRFGVYSLAAQAAGLEASSEPPGVCWASAARPEARCPAPAVCLGQNSKVPGMRVAGPRDASSLREQLGEALEVDDGPTAIRFPKGSVGADIKAVERIEGVDMLCRPHDPDVLLVAVGPLATIAMTAAATLGERGVAVAVVDPRWVLPVPEQVVKFAGNVRLVVTLEESGLHGGIGSAVATRVREARIDTPVRSVGVPQRFLAQAARSAIHADHGRRPGHRHWFPG
jgi:1-deoxy-D-xylulose-5-phosphate synthase